MMMIRNWHNLTVKLLFANRTNILKTITFYMSTEYLEMSDINLEVGSFGTFGE